MTRPSLPTLRNLIAVLGASEGPVEVKEYAGKCCQLFEQLASSLAGGSSDDWPVELEIEALHQGLLVVLKAYGTPEEDIELTSLAINVEGDSSEHKPVM